MATTRPNKLTSGTFLSLVPRPLLHVVRAAIHHAEVT